MGYSTDRKTEELIQKTTDWIRDYAATNGIRTLVVGVSGGIDSAVVFRLCVATGKEVFAVAMPMSLEQDSCPDSLKKAQELVRDIPNVSFATRPIGEIVAAYIKVMPSLTSEKPLPSVLLQGNLRSGFGPISFTTTPLCGVVLWLVRGIKTKTKSVTSPKVVMAWWIFAHSL